MNKKYPFVINYSKAKKKKVAVAICTVNRLRETNLALNSLTNQTYKKFSVYVVDGRNDEKLDDVCRKFAGKLDLRRVKINKWNLAYSRNQAIKAASPEVISFLDDDAVADSDWLEKIVSTFKKNKNICGIGGKILSDGNSYLANFAEILFDNGPNTKPVDTITGANLSLHLRRIKNLKLGRNIFNENYRFAGEETEACLNIGLKGGKLTYNPKVVVHHHFERNPLIFIKKHLSYGGGDFLVSKSLSLSEFKLLGEYKSLIDIKNAHIFFPVFSSWVIIKRTLRFCGDHGLEWLPASLIREFFYCLGIYAALLKTMNQSHKLR